MSEADPLAAATIPDAFARKFGVVLQAVGEGRLSVALREGADPHALLEVQRHLGQAFDVTSADPAAFGPGVGKGLRQPMPSIATRGGGATRPE